MDSIKATVTLPSIVSDRLLLRLWNAFRSEYISFNGGREKFAAYVEDCVCEVEQNTDFSYSNGKSVEPEVLFPSAETYYNFFNSGLRNKSDLTHEGIKKNVNARSRTLRIIIKFLIQKNWLRVEGWLRENPHTTELPFVENLDDSFLICRPSEIIPQNIGLFVLPEHQQMRRQAWLIKDIEAGKYSLINEHLDLYGVLRISKPSKRNETVKIIRKNTVAKALGDGRYHTSNHESLFDERKYDSYEAAIAIKSKRFLSGGFDTPPSIIDNNFDVICSVRNSFTRDSFAVVVNVFPSAINEFFSDLLLSDAPLAAVTLRHPAQESPAYLLAFPVPKEEMAAIDQICGFDSESVN